MSKTIAYIRTDIDKPNEQAQRKLIEDRLEQAFIKSKDGVVTEIQTWVYTSDLKTSLSAAAGHDLILIHSLDIVAGIDHYGGANSILEAIDKGASLMDCRTREVYTNELKSVMLLTMVCLTGEIQKDRRSP